MINFENRFHGHGSLRYLFSNGRTYKTNGLILRAVENKRRKHSRVAVVISKKVLKSAVGRNRIRRRIYSRFRNVLDNLDSNYDLAVIVINPEFRTMNSLELDLELNDLLSQAQLITKK